METKDDMTSGTDFLRNTIWYIIAIDFTDRFRDVERLHERYKQNGGTIRQHGEAYRAASQGARMILPPRPHYNETARLNHHERRIYLLRLRSACRLVHRRRFKSETRVPALNISILRSSSRPKKAACPGGGQRNRRLKERRRPCKKTVSCS